MARNACAILNDFFKFEKPTYEIDSIGTYGMITFICLITLPARDSRARHLPVRQFQGEASSKKTARQRAAEYAVDYLKDVGLMTMGGLASNARHADVLEDEDFEDYPEASYTCQQTQWPGSSHQYGPPQDDYCLEDEEVLDWDISPVIMHRRDQAPPRLSTYSLDRYEDESTYELAGRTQGRQAVHRYVAGSVPQERGPYTSQNEASIAASRGFYGGEEPLGGPGRGTVSNTSRHLAPRGQDVPVMDVRRHDRQRASGPTHYHQPAFPQYEDPKMMHQSSFSHQAALGQAPAFSQYPPTVTRKETRGSGQDVLGRRTDDWQNVGDQGLYQGATRIRGPALIGTQGLARGPGDLESGLRYVEGSLAYGRGPGYLYVDPQDVLDPSSAHPAEESTMMFGRSPQGSYPPQERPGAASGPPPQPSLRSPDTNQPPQPHGRGCITTELQSSGQPGSHQPPWMDQASGQLPFLDPQIGLTTTKVRSPLTQAGGSSDQCRQAAGPSQGQRGARYADPPLAFAHPEPGQLGQFGQPTSHHPLQESDPSQEDKVAIQQDEEVHQHSPSRPTDKAAAGLQGEPAPPASGPPPQAPEPRSERAWLLDRLYALKAARQAPKVPKAAENDISQRPEAAARSFTQLQPQHSRSTEMWKDPAPLGPPLSEHGALRYPSKGALQTLDYWPKESTKFGQLDMRWRQRPLPSDGELLDATLGPKYWARGRVGGSGRARSEGRRRPAGVHPESSSGLEELGPSRVRSIRGQRCFSPDRFGSGMRRSLRDLPELKDPRLMRSRVPPPPVRDPGLSSFQRAARMNPIGGQVPVMAQDVGTNSHMKRQGVLLGDTRGGSEGSTGILGPGVSLGPPSRPSGQAVKVENLALASKLLGPLLGPLPGRSGSETLSFPMPDPFPPSSPPDEEDLTLEEATAITNQQVVGPRTMPEDTSVETEQDCEGARGRGRQPQPHEEACADPEQVPGLDRLSLNEWGTIRHHEQVEGAASWAICFQPIEGTCEPQSVSPPKLEGGSGGDPSPPILQVSQEAHTQCSIEDQVASCQDDDYDNSGADGLARPRGILGLLHPRDPVDKGPEEAEGDAAWKPTKIIEGPSEDSGVFRWSRSSLEAELSRVVDMSLDEMRKAYVEALRKLDVTGMRLEHSLRRRRLALEVLSNRRDKGEEEEGDTRTRNSEVCEGEAKGVQQEEVECVIKVEGCEEVAEELRNEGEKGERIEGQSGPIEVSVLGDLVQDPGGGTGVGLPQTMGGDKGTPGGLALGGVQGSARGQAADMNETSDLGEACGEDTSRLAEELQICKAARRKLEHEVTLMRRLMTLAAETLRSDDIFREASHGRETGLTAPK